MTETKPAKVTTKQGDTWDAIAAEQLGNATMGAEIAGHNGYNPHGAVPIGIEIEIPYRRDPVESDTEVATGSPAKSKKKKTDDGDQS